MFVDGGLEQTVSSRELLETAHGLAEKLAARGLRAGQPVVLTFLKPRELVSWFWACLVLGCVPVPLSPPSSLRALDADLDRLLKIDAALVRAVWLVDGALHAQLDAALNARGHA